MLLQTFKNFLIIIFLLVFTLACNQSEESAIRNSSSLQRENIKKKDHNKFTIDGLGNVKIGSKFTDNQELKKHTDVLDGCFEAKSNLHKNVSYMVQDDIVTNIGISESNVASPYGVKVGDYKIQVDNKHKGEKPEIVNNPYGEPGVNIVIYYWYSVGGKVLGIRYDVDNDIVTSISIGLKDSLLLMEGCA
ncbi:hypothetical protein [Neisseria dumasiana]|uniref:hypothetical protein n=1 Tax=Neisseria dumasiana TaxID=1931275 RepID=UPI000A18F147|nr:hypothetical protein [Neisseria dumasiana]OSI16106.1 hypothetical protein BV914_04585 [Neisseria dumasiana]